MAPPVVFIAVRALVNNVNHAPPRTGPIILISALLLLELALLVNAIVQLTKRSPALVIHSAGVTDNVSAVRAGLIPWSNIAGYTTGRLNGWRHLFIILKDYEAVMSGLSDFRKRMVEPAIRKFGTPVSFNLKMIDASDELIGPLIEAGVAVHGDSPRDQIAQGSDSSLSTKLTP